MKRKGEKSCPNNVHTKHQQVSCSSSYVYKELNLSIYTSHFCCGSFLMTKIIASDGGDD